MLSRRLTLALTVITALLSVSWLRRLVRALGIAIASVALLSLTTSCSVSRKAVSEHSELKILARASEQARAESSETVERVDSVIVEQRDTLREVTTITIDRNRRTSERRGQAGLDYPEREGGKPKVNDKGDTLKVVQITDLTRARSRVGVAAQRVKTEVRVDTVYVEKRDSSLRVSSLGASCAPQVLRRASSESGLQEDPSARSGRATISGKLSAVSKVLKWIFALICAVVVLIITVKVCLRKW